MQSPPKSEGQALAIIAYCSPFVLFLVLTAIESWDPLVPFYPLLDGAKTIAVFGLWWYFRRVYPAPRWEGAIPAVLVGVVGTAAWIYLSHMRWEEQWLSWLPDWLYPADRRSFDPHAELSTWSGKTLFLLVRMLGLSVVVPLMEEVFWRGFLLRYFIADDFQNVPIGRFTPLSFAVVTAGFVLEHPELLAALVWGTAVNLLLYRTKNLWACIIAHAVTNFLLGLYILRTGEWWLW